MAKRTIRVRFWRHKTPDGGYRISHIGDEVDLPKSEIERGEREGVFSPAPVTETRSADVDQKLAGIISRIPLPAGSAESDAAPLHHDIQPPVVVDEPELEADVEDQDEVPTVDGDAEPKSEPEPDETPAVELKRPAKAAAHEKWVEYVHKATGRPESELVELTKDELQAIKV